MIKSHNSISQAIPNTQETQNEFELRVYQFFSSLISEAFNTYYTYSCEMLQFIWLHYSPPKLSKHAQHEDIGGALGEVSNSLQDFGSYSQVKFAFLKCISGAAPFHCQGHHIMKNLCSAQHLGFTSSNCSAANRLSCVSGTLYSDSTDYHGRNN